MPAVEMGGEGKVCIESQLNSRKGSGLFVTERDGPGRQWSLSTGIANYEVGITNYEVGIANHEVSKSQSLFERHRCLPAVDRAQEVPSNLLLQHCREATSLCSTARGAAPSVSTGLKLAESKEPGWSRGWALGWELGLCLRGQSLLPCPQSSSAPLSPHLLQLPRQGWREGRAG